MADKTKGDLEADGIVERFADQGDGTFALVTSPRPRAGTATLSNVAGNAGTVSLLAANPNRKGVIIWNDSSAKLYVKYGATASTTSCTVKLDSDATFTMPEPIYTGAIDGIWASATGAARITEFNLMLGSVTPVYAPRPVSTIISPYSPEALGASVRGVNQTGLTDFTWPTANLMIAYPFAIPQPCNVKTLWVWNGTVVSGNFDIGVYDENGNLVIGKGSTLQAGTSNLQLVTPTATVLPRGRYYMGLALDNTTGRINAYAAAISGQLAAFGMGQTATNFPLGAGPIALARFASASLPMFGLSQMAVL